MEPDIFDGLKDVYELHDAADQYLGQRPSKNGHVENVEILLTQQPKESRRSLFSRGIRAVHLIGAVGTVGSGGFAWIQKLLPQPSIKANAFDWVDLKNGDLIGVLTSIKFKRSIPDARMPDRIIANSGGESLECKLLVFENEFEVHFDKPIPLGALALHIVTGGVAEVRKANVKWILDFSTLETGLPTDPATYPGLFEERYRHGSSNCNYTDGTLEITPPSVDYIKPASRTLLLPSNSTQTISVELDIEVSKFEKHGGVQIAFSDGVTFQYLDGAQDAASWKYWNDYIGANGSTLGYERTKQGQIKLEPGIPLGSRHKLVIQRTPHQLQFHGISSGGTINAIPFNSNVMQELSANNGRVHFRSYGSHIKIYRIIITVP